MPQKAKSGLRPITADEPRLSSLSNDLLEVLSGLNLATTDPRLEQKEYITSLRASAQRSAHQAWKARWIKEDGKYAALSTGLVPEYTLPTPIELFSIAGPGSTTGNRLRISRQLLGASRKTIEAATKIPFNKLSDYETDRIPKETDRLKVLSEVLLLKPMWTLTGCDNLDVLGLDDEENPDWLDGYCDAVNDCFGVWSKFARVANERGLSLDADPEATGRFLVEMVSHSSFSSSDDYRGLLHYWPYCVSPIRHHVNAMRLTLPLSDDDGKVIKASLSLLCRSTKGQKADLLRHQSNRILGRIREAEKPESLAKRLRAIRPG